MKALGFLLSCRYPRLEFLATQPHHGSAWRRLLPPAYSVFRVNGSGPALGLKGALTLNVCEGRQCF